MNHLLSLQLYEDFADRFDLHEVKLAIVHCAGLYDAALIEDLWRNIVDKGLWLVVMNKFLALS